MTSKKTILIIEDETFIVLGLRDALEFEGFRVVSAARGRDGINLARQETPDAIILDLMLPDLNGYQVCEELRRWNSFVPILMLTARSQEIDKIRGLNAGADDYMTKPFSVRELVARVKALLRRMDGTPAPSAQAGDIDVHGLRINTAKRQVEVHGQRVELTPKEYDLLLHLATHPGVTFTRDELLSKVWGYEFSGYEHTVNSHINRLRNKVERDIAKPEFILTTWGVGYRFIDA